MSPPILRTLESLSQFLSQDYETTLGLSTFREGRTELLKDIQRKLKDIGAYNFELDGLYGPRTEIGLTKFCDAVFLDNMQTQLIGATFAQRLLAAPPPSITLNEPGPISSSFIRPVVHGVVTSEYGYRWHPITGQWKLHAGIDIGDCNGKPVLASASGKVNIAGFISGYGNFVELNHSGGVQTAYGHMTTYSVSKGDTVTQGEQIGIVGATGGATGPHLHFEFLRNGEFEDPREIVNFPARYVNF